MNPNYKNWMPKGMIWSFAAATAVALALTLIIDVGWLKILSLILTLVLAIRGVFYPNIFFARALTASTSMGSRTISSGSRSRRNCI